MKKLTIDNKTWEVLYFKKGYYFIITKDELKELNYDQQTLTFKVDNEKHTFDVEVIHEEHRIEHILKHMIEYDIQRFETFDDSLVSIRLYEKSA